MEQITENVFIENGVRGCNHGFIVTSEGVVLIDAPLDLDYAKAWAEEVAKWGEVRYIINTEHHLDHWLSNSLFDGEVISSEPTRDTMLTIDLTFIRNRIEVLYIDPVPIPEGHQLRLPAITYAERMTLYLGGHTLELIHTPGHTTGQTTVYVPEEKVVFTGDNVFGKKRTAFHQAFLDKWLDSLKVLEKLDFRFVVPGHGEVCDKEYLNRQASIVRGLLETLKKPEAEGLSLDKATQRNIDPFYDTRDIGLIP
jgi:cyclase